MKRLLLVAAWACVLAIGGRAAAAVTGPGDIIFIGFNANGDDDLSFLLMKEAAPLTEIHFADKHWNGQVLGEGGAFDTAGEGGFTWTSPADMALPAGTVIVLNAVSDNDPPGTTNLGTFLGGSGMSSGGESVYAYLGTISPDFVTTSGFVPTAFVSYISSNTLSATTDPIDGTGLTAGANAITLQGTLEGAVVGAKYIGPRSGKATLAEYLPLINDVTSNWTLVRQMTGQGTSLLPFDTTPFTTGTTLTLGDLNFDGSVNAADIQDLLEALVNLEAFKAANDLEPEELLAIADLNEDSAVTNTDIQGLIGLISGGGGGAQAVPEPAGYLLVCIGALGMLALRRRK